MKRWKWTITGGVQGVGFRPFVYKAALQSGVSGHIANTSAGVLIEVQGSDAQLIRFADLFDATLPPLARIVDWKKEDLPPQLDEMDFVIHLSTSGSGHQVLISPDVATCDDCLADLNDPANRRFGYAFTNCTNCGPRYTITRSIPYDRATTSMSCFPLCPDCAREYTDPLDRRFHAQPNACPVCGPRLWLTNAAGDTLADNTAALKQVAALLLAGHIVAMKGLGGFHLVCDARNHTAVRTLRERKNRRGKPLAIMVQDMVTARHFCALTAAEEQLLAGRQRPIVLSRENPGTGLAPDLSPDTVFLGLMLPYTPLHHVLFTELKAQTTTQPPAMVMTSGNASSEPICLGNREALRRLSGIADYFLFHDRDILIRCDDSVVRCAGETPVFLRRARGYTPAPVDLVGDGPVVLGVGPLLKNTLCLTKGSQAFVSQHIGDLENLEAFSFFREIGAHMEDILQVSPTLVVHDLHPDFLSTDYARTSGLPCLGLQHHFAHIHAVLAENMFKGRALGLALDGTGLGEDGTIWGGEALLVDTTTLAQQRIGHFRTFRLPGGDQATREPWRLARACLHELGIQEPTHRLWPWLPHRGQADRLVGQMLDKQLNSPVSSSCGRLFDAVAAMLDLCETISYEGQAAIRLEAVQDHAWQTAYPCPITENGPLLVLDVLELFGYVYKAWEAGEPVERISRSFHLGLVDGLTNLCCELASRHQCRTVGLSGGVMQNLTLAQELPPSLSAAGLTVLTHHELPPNDACISLGQAAYGRLATLHDNGAHS